MYLDFTADFVPFRLIGERWDTPKSAEGPKMLLV
jgi:hypothetical protein